MEFEKLLTKKQIAKILQVVPKSIDNYVDEGMPIFSENPTRYILVDCLEWLKTRKRKKRVIKEK